MEAIGKDVWEIIPLTYHIQGPKDKIMEDKQMIDFIEKYKEI